MTRHEAEPENLNVGKDWSEMDLWDLRNCVQRQQSVTEMADFLMRTEGEVIDKVCELKLAQSPQAVKLRRR